MYLETKRLAIRSLMITDEKAFIEMAKDGSLEKDIFPGYGTDYGVWMRKWLEDGIEAEKRDNPKDWIAYTITERMGKIPVGSVGCTYYEDLNRVGLVYFIGAPYRGNGYAAEAARAYALYCMEKYGMPEISLIIRKENTASCKTAEKAGFSLIETKLYQDYADSTPYLYCFYTLRKENSKI